MRSQVKTTLALIVLMLVLFAASASAERAEACDFTSAHHMLIDNFRSGQDYRYFTLSDPAFMQSPQQWEGVSFWQGYDSLDPLDGFLELKPLYTANYYDARERMIGVVWVSQAENDTVRALLIDPEGYADGAHGCAALEMPREMADAWFEAAFEELAAVSSDGFGSP